jgi:hypothetical protein
MRTPEELVAEYQRFMSPVNKRGAAIGYLLVLMLLSSMCLFLPLSKQLYKVWPLFQRWPSIYGQSVEAISFCICLALSFAIPFLLGLTVARKSLRKSLRALAASKDYELIDVVAYFQGEAISEMNLNKTQWLREMIEEYEKREVSPVAVAAIKLIDPKAE